MRTSSDPLREFFIEYQHRVLRYLCRVLPTTEAAEDVAQEVFRVLFARWLDGDEPLVEPENLLFQLAHHRMCNWWRHHARVPEELTDFVYPSQKTAAAILEAGTGFTDHVTSEIDLGRALQCLPFRQRQALALRFYNGLTVEETAAVMGISPSGAKKATAAGLKTLRESPLMLNYTRTEVRE